MAGAEDGSECVLISLMAPAPLADGAQTVNGGARSMWQELANVLSACTQVNAMLAAHKCKLL